MTAKDVREKFITFFKSAPRNHIEISPAPLVLENDPTTLFTSSGMQPLVPYLMGEPHPSGSRRLVDSQPSLRLQDIDEVGDNRHTTFFEMLGNWSLGDYFKKDQLPWVYEFFTKELGLPKDHIWVSVFEGNKQIPKDEESFRIWRSLGIPENRICFTGVKKNWWSRSGTPNEMPVGEIGGPDSEVFFEFPEVLHNTKYGKECHPNCDCGRFLEIGNSVFIQYKKISDTKLEELPNKNVDFGGGFERILAAVNNTSDIFKTDLFSEVISTLENEYKVQYGQLDTSDRSLRIVADHLRASVMLISNGVIPGNKSHGYILRRLLRRAILHSGFISGNRQVMIPSYDFSKYDIPVKLKPVSEIGLVISEETTRFSKALERGMKKLDKAVNVGTKITGDFTFDLYQTEGFPLDLTIEVLEKRGMKFNAEEKQNFLNEFEKHKDLSRATSAGIFKGGLADESEDVVKLHTATHLLLASLRKVLGEQVVQKGQNITRERSRFDIPNQDKLSDSQIKEVEQIINDIINKDLTVNFSVLPKNEALATGAIHGFNEKYADTVKVYYVGNTLTDAFSKEFCGGPHVASTGEIGRVRINKQEKIGSGIIRIYLVLE